MVTKTGFSPIFSSLTSTSFLGSVASSISKIGKVYGIITTENTPTKELFEANGGFNGIGTIFYLDYNESTKNIDNIDLTNTL